MTTNETLTSSVIPDTLNVTIVYMRSNEWICTYVLEVPGAIAQERTLDEARTSVLLAARDVLLAHREAATEPEIAEVLGTEAATVDLRR